MLETPLSTNGTDGAFLHAMPLLLRKALLKFLLDSRTGNIRINVKDGKILGFHVEEIVSLKH